MVWIRDEEEYSIEIGELTHDTRYAAQSLGRSKKALCAAIEVVKQAANLERNVDVWIDVTNGNLFLPFTDPEEAECIGNIFFPY